MQTHSPQGSVQKQPSEQLPNPCEKNSFANLKSTGQTGRSSLGYSPGIEAAGSHLGHFFVPLLSSSSSSPSTSLQSARIPPRAAFIIPWSPVFTSGVPDPTAATQRKTLITWPCEACGACIPGFHGTITTGKASLGRLPSLGHCTDRRQKHMLSLSEKEAYFKSYGLKASLLVWHTSRGQQRCSPDTVKTNKFSKVTRLQNKI